MSLAAVRKWAVLVDGSSVSAKAFDAASLFVTAQNGKGGEDHLTVVHAFDPHVDKSKAWHLQGPFILSSYETNLIKARRTYDGQGPQKLRARVLSKEYKHSSEDVEVCHQDLTRKVDNVEHAPALVAALLKCNADNVRSNLIFVGSFGEGGKKVGRYGTVTDYLVRLTNATTVIVNHWRPLPRLGEPISFVVAIDGGDTSFKALQHILQLAKRTDSVVGLLVSRHKGPADQKIMDQVNIIVSEHQDKGNPQVSCKWVPLDDPKCPLPQVICNAAESMEADFLVIGSQNLRQGSSGRETLPLLGSTGTEDATASVGPQGIPNPLRMPNRHLRIPNSGTRRVSAGLTTKC